MKLVVHEYGPNASRWTRATLDAGAVGAKTLDKPERAYELATLYPRATIVYRRAEPWDLLNMSDWRRRWPEPASCAETLIAYTAITPRPNLVVEGINEPKLNSIDDAQWYGRVEAERARLLARRGLRAAIGGFATGNPRPELFGEFARAYRAAGGPDTAYLNLHEYSHHLLEPGFGPGEDHLNLLRHRLLLDVAAPWLGDMQVIIGETGLDTVDVEGLEQGKPFGKSGWSEGRYWQRMLKYNALLEESGRALMACWYAYLQPGWGAHEMNDLNEINTTLVAATSASVPAEEPVLFAFDGAGARSALYRSPGGAALPVRSLTYTVHVYEVRRLNGQDWWRVMPAANAYWMMPLKLRAV